MGTGWSDRGHSCPLTARMDLADKNVRAPNFARAKVDEVCIFRFMAKYRKVLCAI
jgi:hypothetical protein